MINKLNNFVIIYIQNRTLNPVCVLNKDPANEALLLDTLCLDNCHLTAG